MSALSGDKSRHNRQRKAKIAKRALIRKLALKVVTVKKTA
jgi:hypothetical protein